MSRDAAGDPAQTPGSVSALLRSLLRAQQACSFRLQDGRRRRKVEDLSEYIKTQGQYHSVCSKTLGVESAWRQRGLSRIWDVTGLLYRARGSEREGGAGEEKGWGRRRTFRWRGACLRGLERKKKTWA